MRPAHVIGVDPGLVHTGLVGLTFWPEARQIDVAHEAIVGPDATAAGDWVTRRTAVSFVNPVVFVEGYRPRSHLASDKRMVEAVAEFRRELDATVLLNTGVKKVVRSRLMELLGVWKFTTVTHHQDLRAAARIMLLGMLRSPAHNALLTEVVRAHLRGETWDVRC